MLALLIVFSLAVQEEVSANMLMRDVSLKNKEFIEVLDSLSNEAGEFIENNKEALLKCVERKLWENSHFGRKELLKEDLYVTSPHYDILPDNLSDIGNNYDPTGEEYLRYMMDVCSGRIEKKYHKSEDCGWPNKEPFLALDDLNNHELIRDAFKSTDIWAKAKDVSFKFLGGSSMALFAIYPPGSYIPWHHNGNAPGYNILAHYSWGGDGYFCTWDNGSIVKYPDKDREWCVRVGRYLDTIGGDARTYIRGTAVPFADTENASWHAARTNSWRMTISTIFNYEEMWLDLIDDIESE